MSARPGLKKPGKLLVISAPSGAGKTTLVNRLMELHPELKRSVSYTTRKLRKGERNGRDYHFVTRGEFERRKKRGFFLEWAKVFGEYYGTSKSESISLAERGKNVVLTIDVQGMRKVARKLGKHQSLVTTVFLKPPSIGALRRRLFGRRTEQKAEAERRLNEAKAEIKASWEYDQILVNRNVEQTVRRLERILSLRSS